MPPTDRSTPAADRRKTLQRLIMMLVAAVTVLDGAIIGVYYAAHIPDRPVKTQQTFVAVWLVLTLLVVSTMMKRIRKARRGR